MAKTLLYRLFGVGKVPEPWMAALEQEGILLWEEGIPGSVTYLNFRAPGQYSSWRRQWYTTAIVLTAERLVALRYSTPIINVPVTDERFRRLGFSLEGDDRLVVALDAGLFHDDWSGTMEYRFRTPQASTLLEMLRERAVSPAPVGTDDRANEAPG
jgi:hypothetical protein